MSDQCSAVTQAQLARNLVAENASLRGLADFTVEDMFADFFGRQSRASFRTRRIARRRQTPQDELQKLTARNTAPGSEEAVDGRQFSSHTQSE